MKSFTFAVLFALGVFGFSSPLIAQVGADNPPPPPILPELEGGGTGQPNLNLIPIVPRFEGVLLSHVAFSGEGRGPVSRIAYARFKPPVDGPSCLRVAFLLPENEYTRALIAATSVGDMVLVNQDRDNQIVEVDHYGYLRGFKNEALQILELEALVEGTLEPEELTTLVMDVTNVLQFIPPVERMCRGNVWYVWIEQRF